MNEAVRRGCEALIRVCGNVRWGETALVVTDATTRELGECLMEVLVSATNRAELVVIPRALIHGQEPPDDVAEKMLAADIVFGLPCMSMAHTRARLASSVAGTRYLSLPDYDCEQLASPALQTDFRALTGLAKQIAGLFTRGSHARLVSAAGTRLDLDISCRIGNAAPGWCERNGTLASPPDAESNVAPVEGTAEGTLVIDGSIPCAELGLLQEPLTMAIQAGRIVDILGPRAATLAAVLDRLEDPATRVLAELGVGLNPAARLCGSMLEDEGCRGTIHLGFGSNATIGGRNSVPFHLDMVLRHADLRIDDHLVLEHGHLVIPEEAL